MRGLGKASSKEGQLVDIVADCTLIGCLDRGVVMTCRWPTSGAVPLVMYGRWMTGIPHRVPIVIVLGRPIEVPKVQDPSQEMVDQYLQRFIEEMAGLFERNKASAGCSQLQLQIV